VILGILIAFAVKQRETQEAIKAWEDYLKVELKGSRANQVQFEIERLK
jgi:hypothetical protein